MSFGEYFNAFSALGGAYSAGQREGALAKLGEHIQSGDYAGAAKLAFDAGDTQTGLGVLKLGQAQQQQATSSQAFGALSAAYGGGAPDLISAQPTASPARLPSFSGGSTAVRMPADPAIESRFVDTLRAGGLTNPNGLAAMAAYAGRESGYKPSNITGSWSDPSESGQAGTSGGILSWRGDRLANMRRQTAGAADPVAAQAKFALTENPDLTLALQNAKSPEEANSLMANAWRFAGFNRPGGENAARLAATQAYVGKLAGMTGRPAAAAEVGAAPRVASQQTASSDMPAPDAVPAQGFVIPPGGSPQVSAEAAARLSQAGVPAPIASSIGAGAPGSQQRIGALIRVSALPGLPDGAAATVKALLQNELEQTKLPEKQKDYLLARSQGFAGSYIDYQKTLQAGGPTTVAAGSSLVDPITGQVIYQAPDKDGGGFTLSPGQARFDPNGRRIAGVDDRDKSAEGEAKLRTEFTKQLGTFGEVQDGYRRLIAATEQREANPSSVSPASDIGLIFGFMKMLDPGSVVREGEYATAQNAAGIPDRVRNAYNKALSGEFLTGEQRQDFVDTAGRLYGQARQGAEGVAKRYRGLAEGQGLNVDRVVALPDPLTGPQMKRAAPKPPADGVPAVGTVMKGYRFRGGDPASQQSWEKVP